MYFQIKISELFLSQSSLLARLERPCKCAAALLPPRSCNNLRTSQRKSKSWPSFVPAGEIGARQVQLQYNRNLRRVVEALKTLLVDVHEYSGFPHKPASNAFDIFIGDVKSVHPSTDLKPPIRLTHLIIMTAADRSTARTTTSWGIQFGILRPSKPIKLSTWRCTPSHKQSPKPTGRSLRCRYTSTDATSNPFPESSQNLECQKSDEVRRSWSGWERLQQLFINQDPSYSPDSSSGPTGYAKSEVSKRSNESKGGLYKQQQTNDRRVLSRGTDKTILEGDEHSKTIV